jgi:hypothetical protein
MCIDETLTSNCLCLKVAKAIWGKLSSTWSRTCSDGVCLMGMEALSIRATGPNLYWP